MPCNPSAHSKIDASRNQRPTLGNVIVSFDTNNAGILNLSSVIHLRILAANNSGSIPPDSQSDSLVETIGAGAEEHWYERVEDSLRLYVETLTPVQFLDGAQAFLGSVGLNGITTIIMDGKPLGRSEKLDLKQAVDLCRPLILDGSRPLREIEVSSSGQNDQFQLWLTIYYPRKHRHDRAAVELEISLMSNELGPKKGESFFDYKSRIKALESDAQRYFQAYRAIDVQKKALFADFSHHLSEAFPGVELQLYECVSGAET